MLERPLTPLEPRPQPDPPDVVRLSCGHWGLEQDAERIGGSERVGVVVPVLEVLK